MSSWEVAAFSAKDGPSAQDLRRAVVARAVVTSATESAKEEATCLDSKKALTIAAHRVSPCRNAVDIAKQAKDTEAAVNLGISTKRLLSALDEAEKAVSNLQCTAQPDLLTGSSPSLRHANVLILTDEPEFARLLERVLAGGAPCACNHRAEQRAVDKS